VTSGAATATSATERFPTVGSPLRRVLPWLPLALLAGVAAEHFALVACCELHPWLGGGFGLFSTVDERRLVAVAVGAQGEERLALPEAFDDAAERAEALPSEARLRAIAEGLAADPPPVARAVRVEVWETRFGPAFEPRHERLGAVQVEVPAPGGS
jgi:hypothetical protein